MTGLRRWGSAGLGLLSAVAAVLFVLAPAEQHVTTYEWPSAPGPQSTALPLFPYQPERFDANFDCPQPRDGLILASTPPAGQTGEKLGGPELTVRAESGSAVVKVGSTEVAKRPLGGACAWRVHVDAGGTTVEVDGQPVAHHPQRPIVSGLFTESPNPSLHVSVVADTRFDTDASVLKIFFGILAALSLLALLVLTIRWDARFTRRARVLPRRWWRPRPADLVVTVVLFGWSVIGPLTVDDGYIVSMLKSRADAGFVGNYFRWFNAPEAPFGWFYEVYRLLAGISAHEVWLRLPSVVIGLVCWILLDRLLLPRLIARPTAWTRWVCAAVFLLWYLPLNIGVRPEPWIVLGSLVVFALVERALATNAVAPLAIGIVVAGATVAVTPTGVAAFLPFVAAIGGVLRLLRRRRDFTWPPLIGLLFATGGSALLFMFYDQTLSTVLEATRIRTQIGPSYEWQKEITRYTTLLDPTVVEGALNRRVPILLMLFCLVALAALLLYRRTPGLAAAANRRLAICSALYLVALMFTPTKWTHHFGALAGFGVLLITVVVHTIARGALRAVWARSVTVAVLAAVVALALSAPDRWWYISGLGVLWTRDNPSVAGFSVANLVLAGGVLLAVAGGLVGTWRHAGDRPADQRAVRWLPSAGSLLVLVTVATVLLEVGSMVQAVAKRWDTYTIGRANLASLTGRTCGLEDWLGAEPDRGAGVLRPVSAEPARLAGFLPNAGFPSAPPAPYGSDAAHPVWGSYQVPSVSGALTSPWYALPPGASAPDAPPLVVARAGSGTTSLRIEYARADGSPAGAQDVDAGTDGAWEDARLDPAQAPGAERVRVVANYDGVGNWVAVSAPRLPVLVPTTRLVPIDEPVAVDWPNAFVLPCRRPASLADGKVQQVKYRFAPGADRELAGMAYDPASGGPYAPLVQLANSREVPTYLRGDKLLQEPVTVFRLDYTVTERGIRTTRTTRPVSSLAGGPPVG